MIDYMVDYIGVVFVVCFVGISAFFAICAIASCANGREQSMTDEMLETKIKVSQLPLRSKEDAAWVAQQNARKGDR